jgi:hypothetical protein
VGTANQSGDDELAARARQASDAYDEAVRDADLTVSIVAGQEGDVALNRAAIRCRELGIDVTGGVLVPG